MLGSLCCQVALFHGWCALRGMVLLRSGQAADVVQCVMFAPVPNPDR